MVSKVAACAECSYGFGVKVISGGDSGNIPSDCLIVISGMHALQAHNPKVGGSNLSEHAIIYCSQ